MGAVIEGLVAGAIDAIATDHAPHPGSEKMQEFEKCPFGILGLETALGLSLERLVHTRARCRSPTWWRCSRRARREVLRLDRGTLGRGRAGGCHHLQRDVEWTYDVNQSFSKSRNSPFHGAAVSRRSGGDDRGGSIVWRRDP